MSSLTPDIWVEWLIETVPSGTTTYRWAYRPLADEDSFKEPRLRLINTIRRECSTDDGEPTVPTCEIDLFDDDGVLRGIMSDAATRHGAGGEIAVRILSETARKAGIDPSALICGTVARVESAPERRAKIKITGTIGGLFSDANKQKSFPQLRIGDEHPHAPASSKGLVYPVVIGVFSDVDAVDADGNSAEKGLLPAIDLGDVLLLADGTEVDQDEYPLAYLDAPENLEAEVEGTEGTTEIRYDVTALSESGETTVTTITVSTAPDVLNGTDYVALTWDDVDGAFGYYVYRNRARLAHVDTNAYDDVGAATTGQPLPTSNTALTTVQTDDGEATPWTRMLAAGKAVHVEHVYASDLADGAEPARTRLGEDEIGAELLIYGEDGYPHDDAYVDFTRSDGTVIRGDGRSTCAGRG